MLVSLVVLRKYYVTQQTAPCAAEAKWRAAATCLSMGYHVLLVDPETVVFQNPFRFLYRDADVEVGTNGWDDTTAYGVDHVVDDPSMGWSRFAHGTRMFTRDHGLVYLRATHQAVQLAVRVAGRVMGLESTGGGGSRCGDEKVVFNEELWLPSHGAYQSVGAVTRVMNYLCWPNSKAVTRFIKNDKELSSFPPVLVRMTYHMAEAAACGEGIKEFYTTQGQDRGGPDAITQKCPRTDVAPDREACAARRYPRGEGLSATDLQHITNFAPTVTSWSWGGVTGLRFQGGGDLTTPWGKVSARIHLFSFGLEERDGFTSYNLFCCALSPNDDDDDDDDDDKDPVWPTCAVGALFRSVRCVHINHVCENVCFQGAWGAVREEKKILWAEFAGSIHFLTFHAVCA
jgi:hypothetical protein